MRLVVVVVKGVLSVWLACVGDVSKCCVCLHWSVNWVGVDVVVEVDDAEDVVGEEEEEEEEAGESGRLVRAVTSANSRFVNAVMVSIIWS
jgi:hypothetical protein